MKKVRWGILGTASIAHRLVVPGIQASTSGSVDAVASRTLTKATTFADNHQIPRAYGSYQELLSDSNIDAIYIPLPNDMHLHWILACIEAGKHVLCEKPMGLNAHEVEIIQSAVRGTGLFIMEGIVSHFHPVHGRARELIQKRVLGDVHLVRMSLSSNFADRPNDFRWVKSMGGGGLLDLGCYCVRTSRMLLEQEPHAVTAAATFDADHDVDTNMHIMMHFRSGVTAMIDCGIFSTFRNVYEVIGTEGRLVVETPFGNGTVTRKLTVYDTRSVVLLEELHTAHQVNQQMEAVSSCIIERVPPPVPLRETWQNMRILDACMASARNDGARISIAPAES